MDFLVINIIVFGMGIISGVGIQLLVGRKIRRGMS
jgi:hypothetical protein